MLGGLGGITLQQVRGTGGAVRTDLGDGPGKAIGANPSRPPDPPPSAMQPWEPPAVAHENNLSDICTNHNNIQSPEPGREWKIREVI